MKKIFEPLMLPLLAACAILWYRHLPIATHVMCVDAGVSVGLLLYLAYQAQFPLTSSFVYGGSEKMLSRIAVSFFNLFSIFMIPAVLAYAVHLTLPILLVSLLALLLGVTALRSRYPAPPRARTHDNDTKNQALRIVFWASIAATVIFACVYGCWISGDYTWHGTYIRKLREISPIPFQNYVIEGSPYPFYGHNIWHLFLALLSYITGLDTGYVWINSNLFITAARISVFYVFARALFRNSYWACAGTVVFLLLHSLLGIEILGNTPLVEKKWTWDTVAYPQTIARELFMYMTLVFVVRGVQEKKLYRLEVLMGSLCIVFTHFYYFFHLAYILGVMFLFSFLARNEETAYFRKSLIAYIPYFLPALVYSFYFKRLLDTPMINPAFLTVDAVGNVNNCIVRLANGMPMVHYWRGFLKNPFYAAAILSIIPVIVSLVRKKYVFWKMYIIPVTLGMAAIFFNPPLMKALQSFNPGLDRVWRLYESLPIACIFTGFLWVLQEEYGAVSKKVLAWLLAALVLLLIPVMRTYHAGIEYNAGVWNGEVSRQIRAKGVLEKIVPPGAIVAVDPIMAWTWTTAYAHYHFMHPFLACVPPNIDPTDRKRAWEALFSGAVTPDIIEILRAHQVGYVICTEGTFQKIAPALAAFRQEFGAPVLVNRLRMVVLPLNRKGEQ